MQLVNLTNVNKPENLLKTLSALVGLTRKRVKALRDKNLYNPRQKARVQASDPPRICLSC